MPLEDTNATVLVSGHVPFDSRQIPLAHSLSATQPRHVFALPSQTGDDAEHCESSSHVTHTPFAAQYGVLPLQSASLPHFATQRLASQNGADGSVQSESLPHIATQKPLLQYGSDGSVQSVEVVHDGATHAPSLLQTWLPSHGVMPDKPKLEH
jgi:hypothetical protein